MSNAIPHCNMRSTPISDFDLTALIESRSERYGPPNESMRNIGLMVTGILQQHYGIELPHPVPGNIAALIMALVKINRASYAFTQDSYDDAKSFLRFAESIQARTQQDEPRPDTDAFGTPAFQPASNGLPPDTRNLPAGI